jgi:hypothetical protein
LKRYKPLLRISKYKLVAVMPGTASRCPTWGGTDYRDQCHELPFKQPIMQVETLGDGSLQQTNERKQASREHANSRNRSETLLNLACRAVSLTGVGNGIPRLLTDDSQARSAPRERVAPSPCKQVLNYCRLIKTRQN